MHNEINGTNGVIESPGYPTKFHSDEKYSWRITVDKNFVILLNIKHVLDEDIPYIKVKSFFQFFVISFITFTCFPSFMMVIWT